MKFNNPSVQHNARPSDFSRPAELELQRAGNIVMRLIEEDPTLDNLNEARERLAREQQTWPLDELAQAVHYFDKCALVAERVHAYVAEQEATHPELFEEEGELAI